MRGRLGSVGPFAALLAACALAPSHVGAQGVLPGDEPLEMPPLAPAKPPPEALELPPLREPEPAERERLSQGLIVRVERFEVVGSTVFTHEELALATAPWTGRAITSEQLLAARDALTRLYVDAGYVTSGAQIPDQDVAAGVVRVEIVEGTLAEVEVEGNAWFRDIYFRTRLLHAGRAPANLARLEEQLRRFQQDPLIERVNAVLEPGASPGESRLRLAVIEARQYRLRLGAANDRSPAIGGGGGIGEAHVANLLGLRDVLSARTQLGSGLRDVEARFDIPITHWDTRLRLRFRDTRTQIVEEPFEVLDIDASSRTYAVSVGQPVYRTPKDEIWLGVTAERRQSEATLLEVPFCFQLGVTDCEPVVSAVRLSGEWTRRTATDVVAARSLLSFGIDALGSTIDGDPEVPDSNYVAWLGQAQWAHVLPPSLLESHLVLRANTQLASDPLLSIEKFAVGGVRTVRGYRENQLVRDNGVVLSAEVRIPVWRDALGRHLLEVVPFTDWGYAWNVGPDPPINSLTSVGVGLRFQPATWIYGEIFWGARLRQVPNPHDGLQDYGLHMRLLIDVL
jgi:hemolysin activation/secretion protein